MGGGGRSVIVNRSTVINETCTNIINANISEIEKEKTEGTFRYLHRNFIKKDGFLKQEDTISAMNRVINGVDGYDVSNFQQKLIDSVLRISSPRTYKEEPPHRLKKLLAKFKWDPPDTQIMFARTSRRMGKTDAITAAAAADLIFVPNIKILYFSLYEATCLVACQTVYAWLEKWGLTKGVKMNALSINYKDDNGNRSRIMFITSQNSNVSPHHYYFIIRQSIYYPF